MAEIDPTIGRFLFDSISKGMYENPLCVLREYVQNSADAIDKAVGAKEIDRSEGQITIEIDPTPSCPRIVFQDNGCGIGLAEAQKVLSSVGESPKFGQRNRGFRGIGRPGGMAYCSDIVFRTKARGEAEETLNRWDCRKMADMLNPHNHKFRGLDLRDVIKECTSFEVLPSQWKLKEGGFRVEMHHVRCARNVLMDVVEVRKYLAQVAPVPFDYQNFPFGREIDDLLRKEVVNYSTYKIRINFEELFKPYQLTVHLSQSRTDTVTGIVPIEILDDAGKIIGRGWRAERKDLLGAILRSEGIEGIRVRIGNILVGDGDLLDRVFSQERFNSYFVGEVHAVDDRLIPNSRRDDFEDGEIREVFFERIRQALGDPLSKLVQKKSSDHSKVKTVNRAKGVYLTAKADQKEGFVSDSHKAEAIRDLREQKAALVLLGNSRVAEQKVKDTAEDQLVKIDELLAEIQEDGESIVCSLSSAFTGAEKELIGRAMSHLYACYGKAKDSVRLARLIVQRLNADRK